MGDNEAAKGLLTLFDATAAAAPVEKKKRAHKPRRPYRCGRCGLPKAGHVCKFRSEQATTGTQTDFTSLQSPVNDLTLLVPRSHSSSDCSATSELSPNDKASGPLPTAVVSERSHSEDIADPTIPESSRPRAPLPSHNPPRGTEQTPFQARTRLCAEFARNAFSR